MSVAKLAVSAGILMAFAGLSVAASADGPVDLSPKFAKGQSYRFSQHTKRTDSMSFNMGGAGDAEKKDDKAAPKAMSRATSVDQTLVYTLKVSDVKEGVVHLDLELTSAQVKLDLGTTKFAWDSASPADDKDASNKAAIGYKPLVGSVTKLTLDASGNITDVQTDSRISSSPPPEIAPFMTNLTNTDSIKARWSTVLAPAAGEKGALKEGSTWTTVTSIPALPVGRFEYTIDSTVKDVDAEDATISLKGKQKVLPFAEDKPAQGKVTSSDISGTTKWNTKLGVLDSQKFKQELSLDINANGLSVVRSSDISIETTRQK